MSVCGPSLPRRPRASVSVIRCLAAALGRWLARQLMTQGRHSKSALIEGRLRLASGDDFDDAHHAFVFVIDRVAMVDKATDDHRVGKWECAP